MIKIDVGTRCGSWHGREDRRERVTEHFRMHVMMLSILYSCWGLRTIESWRPPSASPQTHKFTKSLRVEMTAHVLDVGLELQARPFRRAFERHVFQEMRRAVGFFRLVSGD